NAGVYAQTVREVTGRGGDRGAAAAHLRLVTHAQRAARRLHARTSAAEHTVIALLGQDLLIHLGRRRDPETSRDVALALEHLTGSTEVADVGHAAADEHLVDLVASHLGEELDVVRVVRASHDRLFDLRQINLDHRS